MIHQATHQLKYKIEQHKSNGHIWNIAPNNGRINILFKHTHNKQIMTI